MPAPYGFFSDGRKNRTEQHVLCVITKCRSAGMTRKETAAELNAQGHLNRKGSEWTGSNIQNVEKRSRRGQAQMMHQQKSKKRTRGPSTMYGYYWDGEKIVKSPEEQRLIAFAQKMRAQGLGYRKLAAALTAAGFTTRRGSPWTPATTQWLCKSLNIRRGK